MKSEDGGLVREDKELRRRRARRGRRRKNEKMRLKE